MKQIKEDLFEFIIADKSYQLSLDDVWKIRRGERPEEVEYHIFKAIQRDLRREDKIRKMGTLMHLSKVSDSLWKELHKDSKHVPPQKGATYVKKS